MYVVVYIIFHIYLFLINSISKLNHYIQAEGKKRQRIFVSMADSWLQPKQKRPIDDDADADSSNNDSDDIAANNMPPSDFSPLQQPNNMDWLLNVYDYLPPSDIVNLAETCERLNEFAIENIYRKYDKIILKDDEFDPITLYSLRHFMIHFGEFIKNANLTMSRRTKKSLLTWRYLQIVLGFCHQLVTLQVSDLQTVDANVPQNFGQFEHLKTIQLKNCRGDTDSWHRAIRCMPNLSCVIIADSTLRGQLLAECTALDSLSVVGCIGIQRSAFKRVMENNANTLRHLQIDVKHLKFQIAPMLAKLVNLVELDIISICAEYFSEIDFNTMKKLRRLRVRCVNNTDEEEEEWFEAAAPPILPELEIFKAFNLLTLTDEYIVELCQNCPKLERIDITRTSKVTAKSLRHIIEILVKQSPRPRLHFNLNRNFYCEEFKLNWVCQQLLEDNKHLISFTKNKS